MLNLTNYWYILSLGLFVRLQIMDDLRSYCFDSEWYFMIFEVQKYGNVLAIQNISLTKKKTHAQYNVVGGHVVKMVSQCAQILGSYYHSM